MRLGLEAFVCILLTALAWTSATEAVELVPVEIEASVVSIFEMGVGTRTESLPLTIDMSRAPNAGCSSHVGSLYISVVDGAIESQLSVTSTGTSCATTGSSITVDPLTLEVPDFGTDDATTRIVLRTETVSLTAAVPEGNSPVANFRTQSSNSTNRVFVEYESRVLGLSTVDSPMINWWPARDPKPFFAITFQSKSDALDFIAGDRISLPIDMVFVIGSSGNGFGTTTVNWTERLSAVAVRPTPVPEPSTTSQLGVGALILTYLANWKLRGD